MKLVAGAAETSQPHAFEPVVSLEMSKATQFETDGDYDSCAVLKLPRNQPC